MTTPIDPAQVRADCKRVRQLSKNAVIPHDSGLSDRRVEVAELCVSLAAHCEALLAERNRDHGNARATLSVMGCPALPENNPVLSLSIIAMGIAAERDAALARDYRNAAKVLARKGGTK